jgi:16S rRNA (cytidine1402-2'-O)-methyltransferase
LMGTLYIVGTPIGNLEDMTSRAVRILENVDLIAAEDTRHSGRLLQHFDVRARLISFHGDSDESRVDEIVEALEDGDVAMITDAGMPGISDPGVELVRAATAAGFDIEVIPGPSAVTSAVALSGLVDAGFLFAGYPPRRSKDRVPFYTRVLGSGYPVVIFESPHRVVDSLTDLAGVYPDLPVAVCRELTKLHETVYRGSVREVVSELGDPPPPGEYVVVIGALADGDAGDDSVGDAETIARTLLAQGLATSKVAREVARTCRISRSDAYELVLQLKGEVD